MVDVVVVVIGNFGAHWISEGRSARRFSMYLALPQKIEKTEQMITILPLKSEKPNTLRNAERMDPFFFAGLPLGGHWISEGRSAKCFSMYLAVPKSIDIFLFLTAVPLKFEYSKNETPIHSPFLHVFTFVLLCL